MSVKYVCFSNIQNIEVFPNQYCKHLLKIGSKSINNITLGELGLYRIEKFIKQRMLTFWVRIVTSKNNKISLAIYHHMRTLYDRGEYKSEWLSSIKSMLDQLQMGNLWNAAPEELNPISLNQCSTQYHPDC